MRPTRAYNPSMTRAQVAGLLGLLVAGSPACRDRSSRAVAPAPGGILPIPADGFVYANVIRQPARVPPRFSAELPVQVAAFAGDWAAFPPRDHIADQICVGGDDMRARFLRALTGAAATAWAHTVSEGWGLRGEGA